ncbi:MAG: hypothetical protein CVU05_13305 [Bacteroidetes bacterium HGW-Bacteroidetes-21]|jgi:hypothetical protein|nr:MAG: hypothetical protein CVU05_13305 [Bacteroidetes bacterium HGW-Bacteroidetes-21]
MIAAQELRKKNISEYLLYMYHIEDVIRSFDMDQIKIQKYIIEKYTSEANIQDIEEWFAGIIGMMKTENKIQKGHITLLDMLINELEGFHLRLMNSEEEDYKTSYNKVNNIVTDIVSRANSTENLRITEICLNIMYWYLMQKLSKHEISDLQLKQIKTVSNYLALLSSYFYKYENGLYEIS